MESIVRENIAKNRGRILSLWQAALLPQGNGFTQAGASKSRFTAPTEFVLKSEAEVLLDWLVSEEAPVKVRASLREICKLKAVQALDPSEALGFIFDLKGVLRLVLGGDEHDAAQMSELGDLDRRIDQLMLLAFDEYSECREKIMEIRMEEVQRLALRGVQ